MLGTHSAQTESGLLDSYDQCTPLSMIWTISCIHEKNNHLSLFMNASFSLLKNSDLCCDKKIRFGLKKSDLFLYM